MKKFLKENWFRVGIVPGVLIVAVLGVYYFLVYLPNNQNNLVNRQKVAKINLVDSDPASLFRCPENLPSEEQRLDAVRKFVSAYREANPDAMMSDMQTYRYGLLVSNNCSTTLANMLENVVPLNPMLRFGGKDFGPQVIEFDKDTKVWSSFFTLNGQSLDSPDEELIFNFYLQNVWASKKISAEQIATLISDNYLQSDNSEVLFKFTAPDGATKNPDYIITSYIIYPDENYGYAYLTKVSSIKNDVFSIIYAKKFFGDATNLRKDIKSWIVQDVESDNSFLKGTGNIGVDDSWLDYFAENKQ